MKAYWYFIITFFILASQETAFSQNLKLPYPIIFVHGLTGSDQSWSDLINFMEKNYGLTYGGRMDFCLNQDGDLNTSKLPDDYKDYTNCDLLHPFIKGDIYTINFDVGNDGIPYNNLIESDQSGIVKQGLAVSDAIKHVLNITGKDKVILVGHSMGGLAIREYLQNQNLWYEPYINHHVAKICTVGTPHGGSNFDALMVDPLGYFFNKLDTKSEAVRDLRTSYFPLGINGIYLFGGTEPTGSSLLKAIPFYNWDINCDGSTGQDIVGLNNRTMPSNLAISCIIGTGDLLGGDGVVSEESANINNYFPSINADTFNIVKTSGLLSLWHTELTKQIEPIIRGLDEPDNPEFVYEIKKDSTIKGTITFQKDNFNLDIDLYKIIIDKSGYLTINIDGNPLSGIEQIALLDYNQNRLTFKLTKTMPTSFTYNLLNGTYYIQVRGLATNVSYKYPYILSTNLDNKQISTSTKSITKLEYFIDTDPGFGNGSTLNVSTPNDIDGDFNVSLNNISKGLHILYIRAKDSENKWSITQNMPFYKQNVITQNLSRLEYFLDTDPGLGNGNQFTVSASNDATKSFNVPLSGSSNGFHVLYIRAKDNNENWSITCNSSFYKTDVSSPDIVKIEYFLDTDPGFGNAVDVSIPRDAGVSKSINIDLSNVSNGFHTLYIRTKNASGKWSITSNNAFYRTQSQLKGIIELEYFFDFDPGFGSGTVIPIIPATSDITKQFNIDLACLSSGSHTFYVRAKDELGNWSLIYSKNITVTPVPPIITKNGTILQSNALIGNQWYNQNGLINGATNQDYVVTTNGDYYVIVTHSRCSSDKSNIIKVIVSGVEQTELDNLIKIYPNPTTESFHAGGFTGKALLILTDINGIEILSIQVSGNESISINNLPKGVYIVKIITNEGTVERKMIKN